MDTRFYRSLWKGAVPLGLYWLLWEQLAAALVWNFFTTAAFWAWGQNQDGDPDRGKGAVMGLVLGVLATLVVALLVGLSRAAKLEVDRAVAREKRARWIDKIIARNEEGTRLAEQDPERALTAARGALRLRAEVYADAWLHHISKMIPDTDPPHHAHHDAISIILGIDTEVINYLGVLNHSIVSEYLPLCGWWTRRKTLTDTFTISFEDWNEVRKITLAQVEWLRAKANSLPSSDINDKKAAISLARLDATPYQLVVEALPERVKPLHYLLRKKRLASASPSASASQIFPS